MRTFTAPGKLFLSGEYAVLWGGTARLLAVGPRVASAIRRREDREVHLLIPGARLSGMATRHGVTWSQAPQAAFHFVARSVDLALRAHGRDPLGFDLAFAPSPLGRGGNKLGLGSSARAAVLAAESVRWALDDRYDTLKLALLAHAEAQSGKGSGGDVAACFAGGIVRYRRYDVRALLAASGTDTLGAALTLAAPVELSRIGISAPPMLFAFSGESASTRSWVAQVEARWDVTARLRFVTRSDALGTSLEEGLVRGNFEQVKDSMGQLQALLEELGPVTTPAIDRILALAKSYGCAAKISGAGGGDGCLVIAPDEPTRGELSEGLTSRGFYCVDLTLEPGVRGESRMDAELARWF